MPTQNKNIPSLRFTEFIGDWEEKKMGYLTFSSAFGPRFSSDLYSEFGNVVTLRTTDMDTDGAINYESAPLANVDIKKFKEHILQESDLIISRSGTIGITGIFEGYKIPVIPGAFLIRFRVDTSKASPSFIKLLFNSVKGRNKIESLSAGGVQKNLTSTSVLDMVVDLPTPPEQQKIAAFLTAVDEKIQQLARKKALLDQYKKGVMQKIFSQEIRFKDDNGNDFADWEETSLGELCKITTGKLDANAMKENGEYRFYTCAKDYFKIDKYAFDTEALLISGNGANVGYIHYYNGKFNAYQRTYVLDKFTSNIIYTKYYLEKFLSLRIDREKNEGNTPYIVLGTLKDMAIKTPDSLEQKKIADFFTVIDDKINLVNQQLERTKEYKKGLLQQMFV